MNLWCASYHLLFSKHTQRKTFIPILFYYPIIHLKIVVQLKKLQGGWLSLHPFPFLGKEGLHDVGHAPLPQDVASLRCVSPVDTFLEFVKGVSKGGYTCNQCTPFPKDFFKTKRKPPAAVESKRLVLEKNINFDNHRLNGYGCVERSSRFSPHFTLKNIQKSMYEIKCFLHLNVMQYALDQLIYPYTKSWSRTVSLSLLFPRILTYMW